MAKIRGLAGEYDQRVTVWKDEPTTNADGQRVENAVKVMRRWACVRPLTGRETVQTQQMQADVTHRVTMHSDTLTRTIVPAWWLTLSDGTRLNITSAVDMEMAKIEVELMCN